MKKIFLFCLMTAFVIIISSKAQAITDKPNIIFIMVDDLGKEWISCYGADNIQTPRIDKLAETGMTFHNAWSMPQCTPTRTALLTGQYPWRTGWVKHWDVPRWGVGYFDWEKNKSFATIMKSVGYTTAIAGKWQINDFRVEPMAMKKHGFDDWCLWTGYEAQNQPSGKRYWNAYINTKDGGSKTYKDQFGPDLYCDFLVDFIKDNHKKPMMIYFPMVLTHGPLTTTPDELKASSKIEKHTAMVRYTDKLVGRIVDALDETGVRDNTILIFTTDNGTGGGVRGTIDGIHPSGGKASKFEGGVSEPFIVNCPGTVAAGTETYALTDFTDMFPTFAELGGAKVPADLVIDGKSIAPLILGKAKDSPRDWILAMGHGAGRLDEKGVRGIEDYASRVIRDKRYKVWVNTDGEIDELYDMKKDPAEANNLIKSIPAAAKASMDKFQAVVDSMPKVDARPQYRPRAANPWDKKYDPSKAQQAKVKTKKKKKK